MKYFPSLFLLVSCFALAERGIEHCELHNSVRALSLTEKIQENPEEASLRFERGLLFLKEGKHSKAAADFQYLLMNRDQGSPLQESVVQFYFAKAMVAVGEVEIAKKYLALIAFDRQSSMEILKKRQDLLESIELSETL